MGVEYGSIEKVRFPSADFCSMHDSTGAIIKCKCGQKAGNAIIGKSAFVAFCSECDPNKKYSADFVYRPPTESQLSKAREICGEDKKG